MPVSSLTLSESEALGIFGLYRKPDTMRALKKTYHQLAKRYHPDVCKTKGAGSCEAAMQNINVAYEVLSSRFAAQRG